MPGAETLPIGEQAFTQAGIDHFSTVFEGE